MFFSYFAVLKGSKPSTVLFHALLGAIVLSPLALCRNAVAQNDTMVRIDASQPFQEPLPAPYDGGTSHAPNGSTLNINSRYLMRDGKPWLPVMGEFHFSRYPADRWEEEILKMKAAGVNIVSTYILWIHHEEIEGQFDWKGQRNLRAFVQLCAKHGMYVEPRIGPWAHAEARNGGLPDWVMRHGVLRSNDPVYLAAVRNWYSKIGQQLKGLMWKDGGPVVAVQLENEYAQRGPGAGEEHILELKKIALASGLDVPLYFVTGWDNAVIPQRAVIPVYGGGYPDAPWDSSLTKMPPAEVYSFRFQSRVPVNMGAIGAAKGDATQTATSYPLPYFTAEIGGGTEDTYHRRPVIHPDDIASMYPVMLGSGVNLYGTYMFQGGENPEGKMATLQESQATHYPNDVPIKSYDFQAPLGEFGDERDSFRKMKVFQYFLNDFGAELAPMMVHAPQQQPVANDDFRVPRASVRTRGDAGFLFLNNYVRNYTTPTRHATQFQIQLPGGTLQMPRKPVEIPSGAYFIWPFQLRMGSVCLRYSTAQLFTKIAAVKNVAPETIYFEASDGIPAEFAFDAESLKTVQASSGQIERDAGVVYISGIQPGVASSIDVVGKDGGKLRLVVLTAREAEDAWKVELEGAEHLLVTRQDFFADAQMGKIWLRSREDARFAVSIAPPLTGTLQGSLKVSKGDSSASVDRYFAQASTRAPKAAFLFTQAAGEAPAVKLGPPPAWRSQGVAQAPSEAELPQAGKWTITVPANAMEGISDLFLEVRYQGDVARFSAGNHLLTDNFYNGQPWSIGLRRFLDTQESQRFTLSILSLRQDAPVYLELPHPLTYAPNGQVNLLEGLRLIPEYELVLDAKRR